MTLRIGINGFGRNVPRSAVANFSDIEIVGINVKVDGNTLIVNGGKIRLMVATGFVGDARTSIFDADADAGIALARVVGRSL